MKNARTSTLLLRAIGSILLGGCASLAGQEANEIVSTLQTTAPLSAPAGPVGAYSHSGPAEFSTPAKTHCSSRAEALLACAKYAAASGGQIVTTSGTPSMEPLIHGQTFVVVLKRPYETISKRDILVYMGRPDASKANRTKMLHRAVQHDRYGWIMSGDNNRWSESWDRVTTDTYIGTVVALFEFPQT